MLFDKKPFDKKPFDKNPFDKMLFDKNPFDKMLFDINPFDKKLFYKIVLKNIFRLIFPYRISRRFLPRDHRRLLPRECFRGKRRPASDRWNRSPPAFDPPDFAAQAGEQSMHFAMLPYDGDL